MSRPVIVLGAGVAGLTAAVELAGAGVYAAVLEARDRVGGRIHTLRPDPVARPRRSGVTSRGKAPLSSR